MAAVSFLLTGCHKKVPQTSRRYSAPSLQATKRAPVRRPEIRRPEIEDPSEASNPSQNRLPEYRGYDSGSISSTEVGLASWYGPPYHNRRGANGEVYDQNAMTAAHRTLPMGTVVRVTNLQTGKSAIVKITDRGPFVKGRIIDLSLAAAKETGLYRLGVAKVKIDIFSEQRPLSGGKWCVQVGAFQHEHNAQKLKDALARRYTTAKVIEFPGPTGHWVRINPGVPDKAHAEQVAASVRTAEPDALPYLVRLD